MIKYKEEAAMIDKRIELEHWETEHTMNYHRKNF